MLLTVTLLLHERVHVINGYIALRLHERVHVINGYIAVARKCAMDTITVPLQH